MAQLVYGKQTIRNDASVSANQIWRREAKQPIGVKLPTATGLKANAEVKSEIEIAKTKNNYTNYVR